MARVVLDASAILAHIRNERGSERVGEVVEDAIISAVNFAEIFSKLVERGASPEQADAILYRYALEIVPFDEDLARRSGVLRPATKSLGLSLGDRACLALAQREGAAAITTDKHWAKLKLGVDIQVLR